MEILLRLFLNFQSGKTLLTFRKLPKIPFPRKILGFHFKKVKPIIIFGNSD